MKLKCEGELLPTQAAFIESEAYHPAYIGGYGSGKTYAATLKAIMLATRNYGLPGLFIEPTYYGIKRIALTHFIEHCQRFNIAYSYNLQDYEFYLPQFKSVIYMRSATRPELIKGLEVAWVGIDEVAQLKEEIWGISTSRARHPKATYRQVFVAGTPEGLNWVYEKWEESPKEQYKLFRAHSSENTFVDESVVADLYDSLDPTEAKQKIHGMFEDTGRGRAYAEFIGDKTLQEESPFNSEFGKKPVPDLPICVCCDFNIDYGRYILLQHRDGIIYVFDEVATDASPVYTRRMAEILVQRKYNKHPSGSVVFGDRAGKTRQPSADKVDYAILAEFGFTAQNIPRANPSIKDRVLSVNGKLLNAKGERHLFIHPSCKYLIQDLKRVRWAEGNTDDLDKTDPKFTHASDALGYFVHRVYPIKKQVFQPATIAEALRGR